MADLSAFPITPRWPAQHPDRLQLYSLNTPNGVKVSIMLEEIGLPYEAHLVGFYGARDLVDFDALTDVPAWLERGLARPAVQRGLEIPGRD